MSSEKGGQLGNGGDAGNARAMKEEWLLLLHGQQQL
jgi:hypothetical protein